MSTQARHEDYSTGLYGLPHMGEVIADHRIKSGWTSQETFAIVCGVDKQTVTYWEKQVYFADMDRRIFLCKILKIPPALLGLTWWSVAEADASTQVFSHPFASMAELLAENAYALYEDILAFTYTNTDKYSPASTYRFYKHQQELEQLTARAPALEREAWEDLLSRFYQQATFLAQHHKKDKEALSLANKAVSIAESLDDVELLGASLYRRSRIHLVQNRPDAAKNDIINALSKTKRARAPLKGSSCLLAAEANSLYAESDEELRTTCRKWQDSALKLIYDNKVEDDGTFLVLDLYAVHHERAKTLLRFALFHTSNDELLNRLKNTHLRANLQLLKEARSALIAAEKHLHFKTDSFTKEMDLSITEAKIYLIAREYEESAKTAKVALQFAQKSYSQQGVEEVKQLYAILNQLVPMNPYIANLDVELSIFPSV